LTSVQKFIFPPVLKIFELRFSSDSHICKMPSNSTAAHRGCQVCGSPLTYKLVRSTCSTSTLTFLPAFHCPCQTFSSEKNFHWKMYPYTMKVLKATLPTN